MFSEDAPAPVGILGKERMLDAWGQQESGDGAFANTLPPSITERIMVFLLINRFVHMAGISLRDCPTRYEQPENTGD